MNFDFESLESSKLDSDEFPIVFTSFNQPSSWSFHPPPPTQQYGRDFRVPRGHSCGTDDHHHPPRHELNFNSI